MSPIYSDSAIDTVVCCNSAKAEWVALPSFRLSKRIILGGIYCVVASLNSLYNFPIWNYKRRQASFILSHFSIMKFSNRGSANNLNIGQMHTSIENMEIAGAYLSTPKAKRCRVPRLQKHSLQHRESFLRYKRVSSIEWLTISQSKVYTHTHKIHTLACVSTKQER